MKLTTEVIPNEVNRRVGTRSQRESLLKEILPSLLKLKIDGEALRIRGFDTEDEMESLRAAIRDYNFNEQTVQKQGWVFRTRRVKGEEIVLDVYRISASPDRAE
ncbi:MAG: hypothetical protein QUS07_07250 [Methanothrix sp.]|nr:hypothetical protein [Methanothrix sp.]